MVLSLAAMSEDNPSWFKPAFAPDCWPFNVDPALGGHLYVTYTAIIWGEPIILAATGSVFERTFILVRGPNKTIQVSKHQILKRSKWQSLSFEHFQCYICWHSKWQTLILQERQFMWRDGPGQYRNSMKLVIRSRLISWKDSFSEISSKCILSNMIGTANHPNHIW